MRGHCDKEQAATNVAKSADKEGDKELSIEDKEEGANTAANALAAKDL